MEAFIFFSNIIMILYLAWSLQCAWDEIKKLNERMDKYLGDSK